MKRIYLLIALILGVSSASFSKNSPDTTPENDSIVILFGKKTQIVIHTQDKEELSKLKNYDFNALLRQVISVSEATQTKSGRKDTSFVVDGNRVEIKDNKVTVKDKDNETEVTFRVRVGKESEEVTITENDSTIVTIRTRSKPREVSERDKDKWERRNRHPKRTDNEFVFDVGLNNYLQDGRFPDENNAPYGLRPLGSRYIAVGNEFRTRIGGRKSPLYLKYGLEFSANNFMFNRDVQIQRGPEAVEFPEVLQDLRKSKLTVWYLSVPVMPMLNFGPRDNAKFRIGVGGFVGYRIHSYSKIMYFENGKRKEHDRDNFYLNNLRYGLMGQVGIGDVNLFVKYDLNPLFVEGRGPSLNAVSFGVRF
jgi:hypothetical protein